MPASQKLENHFTVEAEPVIEPDPVFFTDESPEFDLKVTNNEDFEIGNGATIRWVLAIGSGKPEPVHKGGERVILDPGETKTYRVGGDLLSYDGHGVFGVAYGSPLGNDGTRKLHTRSHDSYKPLYSFSVWDRSQYDAVHEQPKRNQKWIVASSILVAILAIIQVFAIFF
ncbi:hypothetical protein HYG81_19350 (plasmid) [Natrinema zhouii]|uniref:hypothetical protein n=1 Tax=Natrinema zhouii TaxID=1710539 RepID=UPI001CFF9C96|nr:hypothetical protein [Natrinema zhouii]UHQ98242.1 hypothetical protein HYG81_19350 [Natrinema zhouii]